MHAVHSRQRRLAFLVVCFGSLLLASSCIQRSTSRTVPEEQAGGEGFEVLVLEKRGEAIASVRSLSIDEAKPLVLADETLTYVLPNEVADLEAMLAKAEETSGDSVRVSVEVAEDQEQRITLSFHYDNRAFKYHYRASKDSVVPIWSTHSDLGGTDKTIYSASTPSGED